MTTRGWRGSLRLRLLGATLAAIAVALTLAGVFLQGLFRDHAMRQLQAGLALQLDELTARLEFDADGRPRIDAGTMSDPRWDRPLSGLYWQVDGPEAGVLRSRSLWDQVLALEDDAPEPGSVHVHALAGPGGAPLVVLERAVRPDGAPAARWRLAVAGDATAVTEAVGRFTGPLAASLAVLGLLLAAASVAQVAVGLAPLRAMQRALLAVRDGRAPRMQGGFPSEVQPLVDAFDGVLDRNAQVVERSRTHAGNLAHAIRTPLAVLRQAAAAARERPDAGGHPAGGAVAPALAALGRVMERVHAARGVVLEIDPAIGDAAFAGDEQDLQEMLGNVLDNAFKWAGSRVRASAGAAAGPDGARLRIVVEDDGPGIPPDAREAVMARGVRADESVPGSGLGLAIVGDLAAAYGGEVGLGEAALGGLQVVLTLPAVPAE